MTMLPDPITTPVEALKALPIVTKMGNQVTIEGNGQPNETVRLVIKNSATNAVVVDETGQLDENGYRSYGPITLANGDYTITVTKTATGVSSEINVTIP
jgi:hypothetical protein